MTVSDGIKGICQYVNVHKNQFKINDLVRIIYLMLNAGLYIYTVFLSDTNLSLCKSCIRVNAMNVHKSYQTITHYHFDWLTPTGDYPKSAIMVVECKDGRWMIVQEFGEDYGCFEGVLKNESDLITKPTFYPDLRSAAMSGFGMMKQLYPLYDDNLFNEFLSEIPE